MPSTVTSSAITPHRGLREGAPLWAGTPRVSPRFRTHLDALTCDVAVVGAGITGAVIALLLAADGHSVAVLDRRKPVTGSTLASTAMINFEIDVTLSRMKKQMGPARARRAWRRSYAAVARLHEMIERYDMRCGWQAVDSLYLAGDETGWRGLRDEARARAAIGLPSRFLDGAALEKDYGFTRTGAIVSAGNAAANPAQMAAECLRAAAALGVAIYSPHDVKDVVAGGDSVALRTAEGLAVIAGKAIFATGYEPLPCIPRGKYDIVSTWALATQVLPPEAFWPTRCLVWEASDPYLYLRATTDNRIVAGGEDEPHASPDKRATRTPAKTRILLRKLEKLLPGRDLKATHAWSGSFATSPTGLPYISAHADLPNCFSVLGCGGNGITYAMIAAELAQAWAAGKSDPDQDLFC